MKCGEKRLPLFVPDMNTYSLYFLVWFVMEMKMMNEVSPLFGINQQFDYNWDEQVQEYLNQYGNNEDFIIEFVDGLVPINYTDIWDVAWAYNLGHVALGIEHATGHTVYELFQHEIAKIYHDEFAEAYYRWTRHEEE